MQFRPYRVSYLKREREMASLGIVSNSNCFRRAEKQTEFTATQIFLRSLQLLWNTIMATKYGSLNIFIEFQPDLIIIVIPDLPGTVTIAIYVVQQLIFVVISAHNHITLILWRNNMVWCHACIKTRLLPHTSAFGELDLFPLWFKGCGFN